MSLMVCGIPLNRFIFIILYAILFIINVVLAIVMHSNLFTLLAMMALVIHTAYLTQRKDENVNI